MFRNRAPQLPTTEPDRFLASLEGKDPREIYEPITDTARFIFPTKWYADGRVVSFEELNFWHKRCARKTEIGLPDGRAVTIYKERFTHKGQDEPLSPVTLFTAVDVHVGENMVGRVDLILDPRSSEYSPAPAYIATLNGRRIDHSPSGISLDLALANSLLRDNGVDTIDGWVDNAYYRAGTYGSAWGLAKVVNAMTPGYTDEAIEQYLAPLPQEHRNFVARCIAGVSGVIRGTEQAA